MVGSKKMKILNIGSMNIDYVYKVERILSPGETLSASSLLENFGGKGLNQSIAAARANGEVYHAGFIGENGQALKDFLFQEGVNVDLIEKTKENQGHAIIQVDKKGNNSIIVYGGSNRALTKDYIDKVLEGFGKDDFLLLQNEVSLLPYIIDRACTKKIKILLNASPIDEALLEIDFNKVYCLLINEIEAFGLTNEEDHKKAIEILLNKYPDIKILLTLGEEGAIYKDKNKKIKQKSFKVEVKDTTAAGDTFSGYFATCLSKGIEIEKALELAAMASAITVTGHGAAQSIPKLAQVEKELAMRSS